MGTPTICNTIKGQNIDLAIDETEFVKGLLLADTGQHSPESKKLMFILVVIVTGKSVQEW